MRATTTAWLGVFQLCMVAAAAAAGEYWVDATTGNDAANGSKMSPWATIDHAAGQVTAGDTVYVKAGDYMSAADGDGIIIVDDDVSFVGYHTNHADHDLDDGQGVPKDYDQFVNRHGLLEMPTIHFSSTSRTLGIAIRADGVVFKNFELTNCERGIDVRDAVDTTLKNLVIHQVGDTSLATWQGIAISCVNMDDSLISNCFIVDSNGQGVRLWKRADHNKIEHVTVVSSNKEGHEGTDYYFNISDSSHNEISNCFAQRFHEDARTEDGKLISGHKGFVIQARATTNSRSANNVIRDCDVSRLIEAFLLRGGGVENNSIQDCVSIGASHGPWDEADGKITISGGAHDNSISRVRIRGGNHAVAFYWRKEYDPVSQACSINNQFDNCIFEDCAKAALLCSHYRSNMKDRRIENTTFINCTFVGGGALIQNERAGIGNEFVNCIICGFQQYLTQAPTAGPDPGFEFSHCCFYNPDQNPRANGFPARNQLSHTDSFLGNPRFTQRTTRHPRFGDLFDRELLRSSPCRGKGRKVSEIPAIDFDGDTRIGSRWDLGAQRYRRPNEQVE